MKNKVKLIDINILSSYMGRSVTGMVTALVIILTTSSLIGDGGLLNRSVLRIWAQEDVLGGNDADDLECFRSIISGQTRRPALLESGGDPPPVGMDLYILSIFSFFNLEDSLAVSALAAVRTSESRRDHAVIIAAGDFPENGLEHINIEDVVFSHPHSVNGFYSQLSTLRKLGILSADKSREFNFVQEKGDDYTRVVFSVLFGEFKLGACRESALRDLAARGQIDPAEIKIISRAEAMPEVVIASPKGLADYYRRRLHKISDLEPDASPIPGAGVFSRMKKITGIDLLSGRKLQQALELYSAAVKGL